jgi:hypothetical protein
MQVKIPCFLWSEGMAEQPLKQIEFHLVAIAQIVLLAEKSMCDYHVTHDYHSETLQLLLNLLSYRNVYKTKMITCTVYFNLSVIQYAKEHGNKATKRHYGHLPIERMICEWITAIRQEQTLPSYAYC